jgi:hypothetical protein
VKQLLVVQIFEDLWPVPASLPAILAELARLDYEALCVRDTRHGWGLTHCYAPGEAACQGVGWPALKPLVERLRLAGLVATWLLDLYEPTEDELTPPDDADARAAWEWADTLEGLALQCAARTKRKHHNRRCRARTRPGRLTCDHHRDQEAEFRTAAALARVLDRSPTCSPGSRTLAHALPGRTPRERPELVIGLDDFDLGTTQGENI